MLAPTDIRLLSEALQAPPGFELDQLVATTYTLDLVSLLAVPLAFTSFARDGADGQLTRDPLLLLEGLRRSADKVTVFCQSGAIAVPAAQRSLFVYLEDSVVPIEAPAGGVFHPKLWILRFTAGKDAVTRLVCMSRNLTADRSRDAILVLDGVRSKDKASKPVGDFIEWLADAASAAGSSRDRSVRELAAQTRATTFAPPDGFSSVQFHPLGIPGYGENPIVGRREKLLVVSPFLGGERLQEITAGTSASILVSRAEEIAALHPDVQARFAETLVLNEAVDVEPEDDVGDVSTEPLGGRLRGLHAKLFVADAGHRARIWVGSANATTAAFTKNVEFLVELEGPKRVCGVARILGDDTNPGLRSLLRQFIAGEEELAPQDDLDWALRDLAAAVGSAEFHAHVNPHDDAYDVEIRAPDGWVPPWPAGTAVRCWPITLSSSFAGSLDSNNPLARFVRVPLTALTTFYAVEIKLKVGRRVGEARFVARWPLVNPPADRKHSVLMSLLENSERILAFFRLMLAEEVEGTDGTPSGGFLLHDATPFSSAVPWAVSSEPLFEALVRTLEEAPARLEPIARIVEELQTTEDGVDRLPDGFLEIWTPIWQAREQMAGRR